MSAARFGRPDEIVATGGGTNSQGAAENVRVASRWRASSSATCDLQYDLHRQQYHDSGLEPVIPPRVSRFDDPSIGEFVMRHRKLDRALHRLQSIMDCSLQDEFRIQSLRCAGELDVKLFEGGL